MMFGRLMLGRCRVGLLRVRVGGCRARTVRGNVAPANFGVAAGAIVAFVAFLLCKYTRQDKAAKPTSFVKIVPCARLIAVDQSTPLSNVKKGPKLPAP